MTDEANAKLTRLHVNLSLALSEQVTSEELKRLKHFFSHQIGNREQEHITDFLDLWKKLDMKRLIGHCEYSILKDAFKTTKLICHLHLIDTFEKKMGCAKPNDRLRGWIIYNKTVESVEALNKMMEKYKLLFPECHGFELDNAVFSYISNSGGQIQLRDGRVTLRVPADALSTDEPQIFWIFRPKAELKDGLYFGLANDRDSRSIVEYSLPVRVGPAGVSFEKPVVLTITDFSFPDFTNGSGKPMHIYRKKDGNNSWIDLGSCFCDAAQLTASAHLNEFSNYVLGLPATGHTHRLNVHVLVGYKRAEDIDVCALHVYILLNDYSYVWEFVQEHTLCVIRQACLYLDTQKDLNVCVVSTSGTEGNKKVRKDVLQALAEFPVQIIPGPMVRHCENATLTLLQGADCLLRLPFVTANRKPRAQDTKITATTTVSEVSATDVQCLTQAKESTDELEKDLSSKLLIGERNPELAADENVFNTANPPHTKFASGSKMQLSSTAIRPSHKKLVLDLEMQLTTRNIKRLKLYFIDCRIASRGDLDSVPDDILELFPLLEQKRIIGLGEYSKLKDALKAIGEWDCIRAIEKFEKEIKKEATMMVPLESSLSEQTSECEKMEVEMWKGSVEKDIPVAGCAKTNRSVRDEASTSDNIRALHNRLALTLERELLPNDLMRLNRYFHGCGLGSRVLWSNDFLELWRKLEVKKIIEPHKYSKLVDAFKEIDALAHLQVIKHFEELMKSEATMMAPLESSLSEQTAECEKMEVEMRKGRAEKHIPVAGRAKINRSVTEASISDNTRALHSRLALTLKGELLPNDLMRLKDYFYGRELESRELGRSCDFSELWRKLESNDDGPTRE